MKDCLYSSNAGLSLFFECRIAFILRMQDSLNKSLEEFIKEENSSSMLTVSLPSIVLPDNQLHQPNGLVIGSILGDGYFNPRGNMTIDHCFARREYVKCET